jgi:hypothetical protein
MWRTKIVVLPTTTPEEVLRALPKDFEGHVTFDVREGSQLCMIHHWKSINPDKVYENLGIELCGAIRLPRFLFVK